MTGIGLGNFRYDRKMAFHATANDKHMNTRFLLRESGILNNCSMIALIGQFAF